jgi:copper homeostasis protein
MKNYLFELCVDSLRAAQAADQGGANRIELCEKIDIGGVTPGKQLAEAAIQALFIPVHVLIRPHGGDFVYTAGEFDQMKEQVQWARQAGAAGIALGVLMACGRVDVIRSRELVELARPMKVTFHRAFDETSNLSEALEAVIRTGADCLLTSGGAPNVLAGVEQLRKLVIQAGDRIQIMAGGGLKLDSMVEVLQRTGLRCLHGSLTRDAGECVPESAIEDQADRKAKILEADVRVAMLLLRGYFAAGTI